MLRFLRVAAVAGAATLALGGYAGIAGATSDSSAPTTASSTSSMPVLVSVRAGHHNGFDRIVMQFSGPLPSQRNLSWVDQVTSDGSGQPVRVAGHRFFQLSVSSAVAHDAAGHATVPSRQTYALPNITQSVIAGDFEGVVTLGVGLQRHTVTHMFTLTSPSRIVVDTRTPFATTNVNVYFLNADRYAAGTQPYRVARPRPVIAPQLAAHALERLFAGPTRWERANALRFVSSHATGFTGLRIDNGIARVQLTGGCASNGATFTIANLIVPTLKQFATVDSVKIYGPQGYTEQPNGNADSIPPCLEP